MSGEPGPADGRRRSWSWALAAGWFPAMGIGMTFSALADRLAFAAWGAASAVAYSLAFRHGLESGRPAAWGLLASAGAFLGLGVLMSRHREALDLGFRAFLPAFYHPALTHPGAAYGLGAASGLGSALGWTKTWKRRMSR